MRVGMIVAHDLNNGIGFKSGSPWNVPKDLEIFRSRTLGNAVIVGRSTWESMTTELPGRDVYVLSKNPLYRPRGTVCGIFRNPKDIIDLCNSDKNYPWVYVIGGSLVYETCIRYVGTIYETVIYGNFQWDTLFDPRWLAGFIQTKYQFFSVKPYSFALNTYKRE